ncbi:hypothetical protein I4I73_17530 [Pseudonocardia sp. KRD-184]|uniref:Uncharacterized protein n=1 Tax=Pseudonocardia oceani TaxID=2792013 RepID=A0ABS6UH86_9PSEU|nr:hypothetical protein [Pseudonocardia oceani]MBW0091780.1 hypothetical protein [Pseudonocardia oceani]MBW0097783.1 hypothetical protein [Pseudonocardia oceani]MBW0110373.1 hypothetical protein [Pseudonocardia oceani]MBW0124509.1 hypothetical protein [Pseudonocardia oceani]MBW0131586.1 hypothetical protein [Pseudonocardia oceani]
MTTTLPSPTAEQFGEDAREYLPSVPDVAAVLARGGRVADATSVTGTFDRSRRSSASTTCPTRSGSSPPCAASPERTVSSS